VRPLKRAGAGGRTCDHRDRHDVLRRYWELFTGGDIRYAAPPFALPVQRYNDWPTKRADIDDVHNETFRNAYELMTAANALRPSGPLTWQPP
jgi:hypothetical protein